MTGRSALLLASCVAAAPLPVLARQGAISEIPASFSECVADYGAVANLDRMIGDLLDLCGPQAN